MAVKDQTPEADAQSETANVQKDVTIMAYGRDADQSARAFASAFDPEGRDFTEQVENERQKYRLKHYDDDEGEYTEDYISETVYKALRDSEAFDPEADYQVDLKHITDRTLDYEHGPNEAVSEVIEAAFDSLVEADPDALEGYRLKEWGPTVQDEATWEDLVEFTKGSVTRSKVLKHQSERDEGADKFEGDGKVPSFSLTVNIDADEDEIDLLSDEVVGHFLDHIARLDGVGKVRVSDCKKRVEQEGDCFDAL